MKVIIKFNPIDTYDLPGIKVLINNTEYFFGEIDFTKDLEIDIQLENSISNIEDVPGAFIVGEDGFREVLPYSFIKGFHTIKIEIYDISCGLVDTTIANGMLKSITLSDIHKSYGFDGFDGFHQFVEMLSPMGCKFLIKDNVLKFIIDQHWTVKEPISDRIITLLSKHDVYKYIKLGGIYDIHDMVSSLIFTYCIQDKH